jgi:polyisoprenoid-binding protein YceI
MKRVLLAVLVVSVIAIEAGAQGQPPQPSQVRPQPGQTPWAIDSSHSAANFSVRHMMVTTVRGQLGPISGTVDYDGKDVRSVKADVRIDVNRINTQNVKRDGHLRSDDFFDAANHPFITFKSKRVEPGADGSFKLVGDLTIRGNTKEVALDVEGPTPPIKGMGGIRVGAAFFSNLVVAGSAPAVLECRASCCVTCWRPWRIGRRRSCATFPSSSASFRLVRRRVVLCKSSRTWAI